MITKKLLTLGLTLTLMSPLTTYAGMGAESGGGGDAVIVDWKVVLRDFELGVQATKIKNNLDFINSIPGVNKLIAKLAQVNTTFAYSLINELNTVTLYKSASSLPILPYGQTAISGKGATIQLATRVNYEVILSPEFFANSQQEFIILHEAIHGLLLENSGPLHHQRVRNIVKYIHDNLDTLNADGLNEVLDENNFYSQYAQTDHEKKIQGDSEAAIAYTFDKENPEPLRCYMGQRNIRTKFLVTYLKLNCEKRSDSTRDFDLIIRDKNLEKFLNLRFPELVKLRGSKALMRSSSLFNPYFHSFELKKEIPVKFFERKIDKFNRESTSRIETEKCSNLKEDLKLQIARQVELNNMVKMKDLYYELLSDESVKTSEKDALIDGEFVPNPMYSNFENELKISGERNNSDIKDIMNLQNLCKQKYPNL